MVPQVSKVYILVRDALLAALLVVGQVALSSIPNVEIVTPLIFACAYIYGRHTLIIVQVFILLEGIIWGPGLWLVGYEIVWSFLVLTTCSYRRILRKPIFVPAFLGLFGALFGTLCSIPYFFINYYTGFTYILQGLPYDAIHAISNIFFGAPIAILFINILERAYIWEVQQTLLKLSVPAKKS